MTAPRRRRLVHWGVQLIGVSDGIDAAAKPYKILVGFKGITNEQCSEDLRGKIARGITRGWCGWCLALK